MLRTGEQFSLVLDGANGTVTATVTELAASLRQLGVGGVQLVHEYPADLAPPYGQGIVLVPWPNRVRRGAWVLDGQQQQLDITEPSTGNATHGLLRNTGYRVTDRSAHAVTLAAPIFPQHGYPFTLETSVRYELVDDGLRVTHGIVNAGTGTAPVAIGAHPYLRVGDTPSDQLTVTVSGETYYPLDETFIPTGTASVAGTDRDLRAGRRLADVSLNTAYTDLALEDGMHRHRLADPAGNTLELWGDQSFAFVQVYTHPSFTGLSGDEFAVAMEPMTAPADALNRGEGLRWLEPGEQWLAGWGIRYVPAA
ncbi:MAG: aldose epimerase [Naasia sp.]|jgi:aldose 1-epimerase|uniref:aldose 1-epimerase family protein n=1 Tax=Naasia sp. TaxID=2546198 RepID=UPI0026110288|nr:aldose 1-epimerase family protein [Naasia sp.]MCU1571704.1 aldose epimerase [Naasia sp.]